MRKPVFALACLLLLGMPARAWENHSNITRLSLQAYEGWEPVSYEPIDKCLPSLAMNGLSAPASVNALGELLRIHADKIDWNWQPPVAPSSSPSQDSGSPAAVSALEVLAYAVMEPDHGMDQNLNLSPDQKYMGGFEGPSSQGIRHMFYRSWSPLAPLVTFHFPLHQMGYAPDRAELFFKLAKQAKLAGHSFWAYRFLGWGLHYVEDMGQPYHAVQFASFEILPIPILMSVGWEAFLAETKRIVANYHLVFERFTDEQLRPDHEGQVAAAFKVPVGDEELKLTMEQKAELGVKAGVELLAAASAKLAAPIVHAQRALMGKTLEEKGVDVDASFFDAASRPKVDFAAIESSTALSAQRKELSDLMTKALSNTGVATRWYVDRFRAQIAQ